MRTEQEERSELIILWSGPWWAYMLLRGGLLRAIVNAIEDTLAICGRTLLLVFLIYCGIKSGAFLVSPDLHYPSWLEMLMFGLQLAGLEGSIPGLARHSASLRAKGDEEGAERAEWVMKAARTMTILSIGEGVLHLVGTDPTILKWVSGALLIARGAVITSFLVELALLIARGAVITSFLVELARLDSKAPRILSREEHEREREQAAQASEQARTIADLQSQLQAAQAALHAARVQAQVKESEQMSVIEELRNQLASLRQTHAVTQGSADGQTRTIADLQNRLQSAEGRVQEMTAHLDHKCRELESAQSQLQRANLQIADLSTAMHTLQNAVSSADGKPADLQTAPSVKRRSADPHKITSIEQARAKHDAAGSRAKMSHAEVVAFMAAHPTLKRAEVASSLGISERKVYEALSWQKDQEHADASAH